MDELYGVTVIAFYGWWARVADWLDRRVWGGVVAGVAWLFRGWAQLNRFLDTNCGGRRLRQRLRRDGDGRRIAGAGADGRVQTYLRILALAVVVLAAILIWSSRA